MLDIESNNEKALLLMKQITDAMRKTETTVAKEKVHLFVSFSFAFLFFLIEFSSPSYNSHCIFILCI